MDTAGTAVVSQAGGVLLTETVQSVGLDRALSAGLARWRRRLAAPLSVRYDPHEKTHGQPLPHLFARRRGTRHEVISLFAVRNLLDATADWAGLTDNGEPVRFTPHDFRRLFTTELVGAGFPLHIAASLLGHLSLDTTRGYTAVFPEHLIAAPRSACREPSQAAPQRRATHCRRRRVG